MKDSTSELIIEALKKAAPHGRSIKQIEAECGRSYTAVKCSMHRLQRTGGVAGLRRANDAWYFANKEDRDTFAKTLRKPAKPAKLERAKPYDIKRREHDEQPKPKRAPPTIDWSRAKLTTCPPCNVDRWGTEKAMADWLAQRERRA